MDVDTSYVAEPSEIYSFSPVPHSAAPTVTGFNTLFFDTMSPRRSFESPLGPQSKKRRSLSPEPVRLMSHENSSSPMLPSSPSQSKLERMSSVNLLSRFTKPTLQGLGAPSSSGLKRPRRPALSAMVEPTDAQALKSAYLAAENRDENRDPRAPPGRRAFSALIAPTMIEPSSDESSFDGPDMSSPAQAYSRRQQIRTIRRCDGTEDFRPLTGASAKKMAASPSSKFTGAGLPGFGDNEAHGKVLPCHRVSEDGLMRINSQTVRFLTFPGVAEASSIARSWTTCSMESTIQISPTSMSSIVVLITSMLEVTSLARSTSTPRPPSKSFCSDLA